MMYDAPLSPGSSDSSILAAVEWVRQLLVGSVATSIAVIAVATVGLLLLTGRVDIRRGITVVFGCFLLFGAPRIAGGMRTAATGFDGEQPVPYLDTPTPSPPVPRANRPADYDPDAGAAVPMSGQSWTGQSE